MGFDIATMGSYIATMGNSAIRNHIRMGKHVLRIQTIRIRNRITVGNT